MVDRKRSSRREFIKLGVAFSATAALAACGAPAVPTAAPAAPTTAPAAPAAAPTATTAPAAAAAAPTATTAAAATAAPTAAAKPTAAPAATTAAAPAAAGKLADVPREQSLIVVRGGNDPTILEDWDQWNPFVPTISHQRAILLMWEPLAFYSAFADKWYMWLAESYEYTPDFKTLTIKARKGIKWSDGVDFTADDITYTFNEAGKQAAKVTWGANIALVMDKAETVDPYTTKITFKVPAPRFFYLAAYHFDIGVYIAPKHIFEKQDMAAYPFFDIAKGLPITTGPWRVVASSQQQKVLDNSGQWWGVAAGIGKVPEPKRIIWLPDLGEQQDVQGIIKNNFDLTTGIQPASFPTVFKGNPKAKSWTGTDSPYGYVDWWPHSLYVNNEKAPWSDKNVRWALSYYLDRQKVVDVSWSGASVATTLPIPNYPPMMPYFDGVKDLLTKYPTNEYNPAKGDALLTAKGWKKAGGLWQDEKGQPVKLEIIGFFDFTSVGPVLVEMLKRGGIDATYAEPPDCFTRLSAGNYTGATWGHGGSCREPYETLALYQTTSEAVPGGHLVNFSRWKNPAFDKIADEAYLTDPNDKTKLLDIWHRAMEIWLPELPDIPLTQGLHRLPYQETYWTNWPDSKNPYTNTAQWHLTFPLVVHNLTAAKK